MSDYIIDKLKERTTAKVLYPETLLESVKVTDDDSSKTLKDVLEINNLSIDYELYSFRVNLADPNPQTRISYFDMAKGRRPAFWNYTNGYFDYGDWSNAFFIKNAFPCMVKYDGTIAYKLDPENYLLQEDGSASDVANSLYEGSAMMAFPTIWIKRWSDKSYLYCSISDKQIDDDYHAYMHTDKDGNVCLYKYIGMYFSTLFTDRYKSLAGQTFTANKTFEEEQQYTHAIGDRWETFSWSDYATLSDLLTLISKSDDSQQSFGYGYCGASSRNATTDPVKIDYPKTPNLKNAGMFFNSAAAGTHSYQKLFHIHNLLDGQYTRLGGLIYLNGSLFVKPYPPYTTTTENYTNLATLKDSPVAISGTSDAYIKASVSNEYGRFPTALGGSADTYECDTVAYPSKEGTYIAVTRGAFSSAKKGGKMGLRLDLTEVANANVANRLTCFSVDPI